jgi:hypothetical protein
MTTGLPSTFLIRYMRLCSVLKNAVSVNVYGGWSDVAPFFGVRGADGRKGGSADELTDINGGAIIDHEAPGERRFVEVGK